MKAKRPAQGWKARRQALGVFSRLDFDSSQRCPCLLRFDDGGGLAVDVKEVPGEAMSFHRRKLEGGHAVGGICVVLRPMDDGPAGHRERPIGLHSRVFFERQGLLPPTMLAPETDSLNEKY